MRYTQDHLIETDVEKFWELFFDPEFNRALYLDHLKFTTFHVVEDVKAADGSRQRRIECVPKIDVPAPARAFFGNSAGYTEVGRNRDRKIVQHLRERGVIRRPEDLGIDPLDADRSMLAARSIKYLVRWSDGLYAPPSQFRNW